MDMGILKLIIICIAGIALLGLAWLFVELAITARRTRKVVADLKERVEPTLAHVEQITSSLEPTIAKLDPLVERVSLTVDALNLEIMRVDQILEDVNGVTGSIESAVTKISSVTGSGIMKFGGATDKINNVISKRKSDAKVDFAKQQLEASQSEQSDADGLAADPDAVQAVFERLENKSQEVSDPQPDQISVKIADVPELFRQEAEQEQQQEPLQDCEQEAEKE